MEHISDSGYVKIDSEVELFYERVGNPLNETLLCIPGALGTTRSNFSHQLDNLSKTFNVIAYDPRGYGRSRKTQRKFRKNYYHQDASDASELMRKLGYTRYSVLGWSDGGVAAMILAARNKSVEKLIIWGATAFVTQRDVEMFEASRDVTKWSSRELLEDFYGKKGLQTLWNNCCDGYIAFQQNPNGSICVEELNVINCPTLILHGILDHLIPEFHPKFLQERIKRSRLITFPEGKHDIHMQYVNKFNEYVEDFIIENRRLVQ